MPITLDPGHVAKFDEERVTPAMFDEAVRHGEAWLHAGAALLRAGQAVLRQTQLDFRDGMADRFRPQRHPMVVAYPAIMLAAFAAENALKGVIAESLVAPDPPNGRLPEVLRGHNLADLAERAPALGPFDAAEQDALDYGHDFATSLGRYPSPMRHTEYPMAGVLDLVPLFRAYERIFHKCAAEVATARGRAGKSVSDRAKYDRMVSGVAGLPDGVSEAAIRITMHANGMTLDHVPA